MAQFGRPRGELPIILRSFPDHPRCFWSGRDGVFEQFELHGGEQTPLTAGFEDLDGPGSEWNEDVDVLFANQIVQGNACDVG